jgi:ABC-type multidrug transport system ATPase subunit
VYGTKVPGSDVGYMPQETAIYEELSIRENLLYYAKLGRMDESK